MYQHFTRILVIAIILMLIGCSGGGGPTTPPAEDLGNPVGDITTDPGTEGDQNTPAEPQGDRVLGNFYYTADETEELLAWGTIYDRDDGWEYEIDYIAPRLRALDRARSERESQFFDFTYLHLISCSVEYSNAELNSEGFPFYEPGDFMEYEVKLSSNNGTTFKNMNMTATQVDMFNHPLSHDAIDVWNNFEVPPSGITFFGDWDVPGDLDEGKYYTRVIAGYPIFGGWLAIILFDGLAASFDIEDGGGPVYYDPVAKGVTTTPTVIVGETVHVQDNGSFDPDGGIITLYEWDVDEDGITDYTGTSADFTYGTPGLKYINLTVTDEESATDDLTDDPGDALIEVEVIPEPLPPVAVAEASKYEAFVGEDITFDGTGSYDPNGGTIILYEWDFDEDGIFEETDIAVIDHSFSTPGVHLVDLRVTNDVLLIDTLELPTDERLVITINPAPLPPEACFTYEPENPIPCIDVELDASCSTDPDDDIALYEWDVFCDGSIDYTSSDPTATLPYANVGDYCVRLTVTDTTGLSDDFEDTITWTNALPTAVAVADANEIEVGDEVHFSGSGSFDNDCGGVSIDLYEWDFDYDGTFNPEATGETTSHIFTVAGLFLVQLQVTDDEGDTDLLDLAIEIEVSDPSEPLNACATWSVDGGGNPDVCESVYFDASCSTGDCNIDEYRWDWNNDGIWDDNYTSPDAIHSFDTVGPHSVQLWVHCTDGQTDTLDTPIEIMVENVPPTAVIEVDTTDVYVNDVIEFRGYLSHDNDCGDMEITEYRWDFDGDTIFDDTGETVYHSYTATGDYTVTLEVEDDEGGTAQDTVVMHVSDLTGPTACFELVTLEPMICEQTFFDGSCSTEGDAPISQYDWDFDEDGVWDFNGTSPDAVWTFFDHGDVDVTLQVTDTNGLIDQITSTITIDEGSPVAVAYIDLSLTYFECMSVEADGSGSYDTDCGGDMIVAYDWDMDGDGTFESTGPIVSYQYNEPGFYTGKLVVTDDEGSTGETTFDVEIVDSMPTAYAESDVTEVNVCETVNFDASGSYDGLCGNGDIVQYEWDFEGDGGWVVDAYYSNYSYDHVGNIYPSCRVTDDEGNTDEFELLMITVGHLDPTAVMAADKTNVVIDEIITFDGSGSYDNDCSGDSIDMYEWNFQGDGMYWVDAGPNPTHSYSVYGTYYPQLRVTDDEGGSDIDSIEINVSGIVGPTACFNLVTLEPIVCEQTFFDASCSTAGDAPIVLYEWDFDEDGTWDYASSDWDGVWSFFDIGDVEITMRVTDDNGLTDTVSNTITVDDLDPVAVPDQTTYYADECDSISFDGSGSYDQDCGGDAIIWYEWDLDGDSVFESTGPTPSWTYNDPDTIYGSLMVTDDEGSMDATGFIVNIADTMPTASAFSDTTTPIVCETVYFDASASYDGLCGNGDIDKYEWDFEGDGNWVIDAYYSNYSYDHVGNILPSCRVTDDEGNTDEFELPMITVNNVDPTAIATSDKSTADIGENINFDGSTSHDNDCGDMEIVAYRWDLDDDGTWDAFTANVNHSFDTAGDHTVTLEVEDDEGGTDQDTVVVTITALTGPTACFQGHESGGTVCEEISVDAGCSTEGDNPIAQYDWDFDEDGIWDVTETMSPDAFWTYYTIGDHDITLQVTDTSGLTDTVTNTISIDDLDPVAVPDQTTYFADECDSVLFDGTGSYDQDCGGDLIVAYDWDLDGDLIYESTGPNPSWTYNEVGTVNGSLKVTDDEGSTDETGFTVDVADTMPTASAFSDVTTVNVCENVNFDASGSYDGLCGNGDIDKYEWDFEGDGGWVIGTWGMTYSYDSVDNVISECRVTDDEGNTDTFTLPMITVNNVLPTAIATSDKSTADIGETINFDGSTSHDNDCGDLEIVAYRWDLDDDGTWDAFTANVDYSFDTIGDHTVTLEVEDDEGGTDQDTVVVTITGLTGPTACFELTTTDPIVCEQTFFNGSCSVEGDAPISQYDWDFDNDGVWDYNGTSPDALWTFNEDGDHDVTLRVTDTNGLTDSFTDTVTIGDLDPVAVPDQTTYSVDECDSQTFDGSGSYDQDCSGDSIVTYEWDLDGNGSFESSGPGPSWTYDDPGTVNCILKVTDNEGSTDETAFTVEVSDTMPVADATSDATVIDVCVTVNFDASASYDGLCGNDDIVQYEWDFEGDGSWSVGSKTANYSYDHVGNYIPYIRVTDDEGNTDEFALPEITVNNVLPTAIATSDKTNAKVNEIINFDGSTSHDNDCGDLDIVAYRWDLDDDGSWDAFTANVNHSFGTAGEYTVTLEVEDDEGDTDQDTVVVTITDLVGPIACFEGHESGGTVCEEISVDAGCSTEGDTPIVLYEWDFDEDGIWDVIETTTPDAFWTYYTVGDHDITLQVTDSNGLKDTITHTIAIDDLDPVAVPDQTTYNVDECDSIIFDGTGSYDQDCNGDSIVTYEWDLDGDGTYESSGPNPSWTYGDPETVNGSLRVTDDEGSTDTTGFTVQVNNVMPTAVIGVDDDTPVVCQNIQFDGTGSYDGLCTGDIVTYEWDFDGMGFFHELGPNPIHSYITTGVRNPALRVTDDEGNTSTPVSTTITVGHNDPTAYGVADKYIVMTLESIEFDGTGSTDNDCGGSYIALYEWDFDGDGSYDDSGDIVNHAYDTTGVYTCRLRVTDDEGGIDTYDLDPITVGTVVPIALATFVPSDPSECLSINFLDDGSYDPDGGLLVSYHWDFDYNGIYEVEGDDVYHSFDTPDTYTVGFKVVDDEGEEGFTTLEVIVSDSLPEAISTVDKTEGTTEDTFHFDGTASSDGVCGTTGLIFQWDADWDGHTFDIDHTGSTMDISYDTPGEYTVLLRVEDDEGNEDFADPINITVILAGCESGIHFFNIFDPASARSLVTGYSSIAFSVVPRADIAYFESGVFKGHGIVQGGYHSLTRFNPNADSDNPIDDDIYTVKTGGADTGTIIVTSLDASPLNSHVAVVTSDQPGELRIVDATLLVGDPVLYSNSFGPSARIMAVDFNSNGDLWIVAKSNEIAPTEMWHGEYVGAPIYYTNWTSYPINAYIGSEFDVFDVAIDHTDQYLYIFDAGTDGLGRVQGFDLTTLANIVTAESLFISLDFESSPAYGYAAYADIEIDHVGDKEECHILLYARLSPGQAEVHKYDATMYLIDNAYYVGDVWPSMSINPDDDITSRDLMCPGVETLGFWHADSYK